MIEDMAMGTALLLAALAAFVPTTSLDSVCQGARIGLPPEDQALAVRVCVQDETAARDELQRKWAHYSANMRETCAEPAGVTFSYVELLTCLEMQPGSDFTDSTVSRLAPLPLDRR
jgi:hypothetical protein